ISSPLKEFLTKSLPSTIVIPEILTSSIILVPTAPNVDDPLNMQSAKLFINSSKSCIPVIPESSISNGEKPCIESSPGKAEVDSSSVIPLISPSRNDEDDEFTNWKESMISRAIG